MCRTVDWDHHLESACSGILTGKYNGKAASDVRLKRDELSWLADLLLTEETLDKVTLLMELANELDMTAAQLAIAWCLGNPNVSTVLLGASKEAQLVENLATLDTDTSSPRKSGRGSRTFWTTNHNSRSTEVIAPRITLPRWRRAGVTKPSKRRGLR